MFKSIEVIVESSGKIRWLEEIKVKSPQRAILTLLEEDSAEEIACLSEEALSEDWLRPEEDKAWKHLQKGM